MKPIENDKDKIARLKAEVSRLQKVNEALADRVERSMQNQSGSLNIFETNALLKEQLEIKSEELAVAFEELRSRQEQLWNSSKLSSLGEMAAGIAHEINNPLTILLGQNYFLENALRTTPVETDKALALLKENKETILRISKIVTGLRVISRDASLDDLAIANVKDVFDLAFDISREKFKSSGVNVLIELDDDLRHKMIRCNRIQLAQVFVNLLNNAFDAMEGHGEKELRVKMEITESQVVVTLSNTGDKVPRDLREKIFEPFFTTKEVGRGTGLGLSVSHAIIGQHGGILELSPDTERTTFVIRLPLYSAT